MDTMSLEQRQPSRGIITLAFGGPKYLRMAKCLAKSLIRHDRALSRAVITDSADSELCDLFDQVIPYRTEYGPDVQQKLHIDLYSPFEETLFIDSDCLAVRPLDELWDSFRAYDFGAIGHVVLKRGMQDPYLDMDLMLDHFKRSEIPKFNGGVYYFKRNAKARSVFSSARALLQDWERMGFKVFRGGVPADEALFGVAMAIHGISLNDMRPLGMYTPIGAIGKVKCDVLVGTCRFNKEGRTVTPAILHFAAWTEKHLYLRECLRIECGRNLSAAEDFRLRIRAARSWMKNNRKRAVEKVRRLLSA
jgi:hypothetical protein